jgi:hypothetical protein
MNASTHAHELLHLLLLHPRLKLSLLRCRKSVDSLASYDGSITVEESHEPVHLERTRGGIERDGDL